MLLRQSFNTETRVIFVDVYYELEVYELLICLGRQECPNTVPFSYNNWHRIRIQEALLSGLTG